MTDREAFEAEYIKLQPDTVKLRPDKLGLNASGEYADVSVNVHWKFWQAAIAHERERCAKVCDAVARRQSYGHAKAAAGDCADFIRSGE